MGNKKILVTTRAGYVDSHKLIGRRTEFDELDTIVVTALVYGRTTIAARKSVGVLGRLSTARC